MSVPDLPTQAQRVELWFSGHDEYYPGAVTSLSPPDTFEVLLDDGTSWPVHRQRNIWRITAQAPAAPAPVPADDDDDDVAAPLAPPEAAPEAASEAAPEAAPEAEPEAATEPAPARRKAGRALRKSTAPATPATPPAPRRSSRAEALAADDAAGRTHPTPASRRSRRADMLAADAAAAPRPPVAVTPRTSRTRQRKPDETPTATPPRPARRTRAVLGQKRAPPDDAPVPEDEPEKMLANAKRRRRAEVEALPARSTRAPTANGTATTPERLTRSAAAVRMGNDLDAARNIAAKPGDDDAVEKLSTKAVTAIAVDAALASARAVLKPLNDRLLGLSQELESISNSTKKAAAQLMEPPQPRRRGRPSSNISNSISAAALESFHLDLTELVGGGEARIKAYSTLTDHEFEQLHKSIGQQANALQELDRLLYAAKALGAKAKKNSATKSPLGKETRGAKKTRSG